MASVFISYIHEDVEVAQALQRFIQVKLGDMQDVFLSADPWMIYAGEDWLRKITSELRSAKVVVLLLTPTSVQRPWVNFEAGGAWLAGKPVIPVCFGGLTPATLPKPYSSLQGVTIPGDWYYLLGSIFHYLGRFGPAVRLGEVDQAEAAFRAALSKHTNSSQPQCPQQVVRESDEEVTG
jgi:hypothetical protein